MIPEGGRAIEDRRSESERKEHAVHVAGHVVAVRLMGGEVLYASIEPFVSKEGIEAMGVTEVAETDYEGHDPRTKEGFDFWVRQSAIKMAGDVAQHIYRSEKQTSNYALSNLDQTMLELLYRKYSPIEDNMLLTQAKTLGTGIVRLKLEEHWNEVLAVAEELTKGDLGEIDSAEHEENE